MEFFFSVKEFINCDVFVYLFDFDVSVENINNMKFLGLLIFIIEFNRAIDIVRTLFTDRIFAWNKYGMMMMVYFFVDLDYGDKFVLKVGSDV